MQGDSCCGEDKKPELQGAFGTKKPKLFKVEQTTPRRNVSVCCRPPHPPVRKLILASLVL